MTTRHTLYLLTIATFLCTHAQAEWVNSLKPPGKPAGRVKVVKAGKPLGGIQLPGHPTPEETNAAVELQHWIKAMTGATLPIHSGKARHSRFAIHTDPSLGDEGYGIAVSHGRIILSGGTTRGVINAVYALLEEDLGCRFYTDDSIRLPETNTLVIAPVARRYVPQLKLRDPFYACAFDPVWSLRNRSNAPRAAVPEEDGGHIDYDDMFVHTAAQIVPPDKYFKEHPDYFAQQADGTRTTAQLCPTHPEVVKIAIAYVRKVLHDNPRTEIVSISKNDCQVICHCPRCTKLRDAEGSDMANQLFLVNKVAAAIEQDYPNVVIDTLAYLDTIQVPKTVRPRRSVAIRLCNDAVGAWSHPFTPAEQCETARLIKAWSSVNSLVLTRIPTLLDCTGWIRGVRSPSPLPSPSGRGRTLPRPWTKPTRSGCLTRELCGSLSLRERAGVRGNRTPAVLKPSPLPDACKNQVHNCIYIWDYNVNFSHYLAPMPNLDVMAANIRFWIKNHAEGVMLQGGYQGPAERDQLKSWVCAKLLWNPAWDEKALVRDFIEGHYSKAAPALEEYEALLGRMRVEHAQEMASPPGGIRYPMDAPFITKNFVTQATAIFAHAKALAQGDDQLTRRVERAELPILYVECVRGPAFVGDSYAQVVADFERIARREKIQYLQEGGPDFEGKLAGYKSQIPKAGTSP